MRRRAVTVLVVLSLFVTGATLRAQTPPPGDPETSPADRPGDAQPGDREPAIEPRDAAQEPPPPAPPPPPAAEPAETRPGLTSFFGDTGLWYLPVAEVLPAGRWSVSGYRSNMDREQGFTDISHFAVTFAYGAGDRAEVFGAWRVNTRIARRVRPLFFDGSAVAGGLVNEYPLVTEQWTGDNVGDLLVGAKVNLASQGRGSPVAAAVRGTVKLPTGREAAGVSTGRTDLYLDGIVSGEAGEAVELTGLVGLALRGDPSGIDLANGLRWGVGAIGPSRGRLRVLGELRGERLFDDQVTATRQLTAPDGSLSPLVTPLRHPVEATLGVVWQGASGWFVDASLYWNLTHRARSTFGPFADPTGDTMGRQVRVGYHPGHRGLVVPPPPPPPPPPPVPQPPTVKAHCDPCTVEVGQTATLTAEATSPAGAPLTYRWTAPAGTFADPTARQTPWTAPLQEGPVRITVTVEDPEGQTASDTVTVQVIRPAVREFVFEDVHFDFDRHTLRAEATRLLDEVVETLQEHRDIRLELEGHTCNIGTAEYNLALGERRAQSVRDYLISRGVDAGRLATVSYGEERPLHDNTREETRRLNRRAALVVRLTQ